MAYFCVVACASNAAACSKLDTFTFPLARLRSTFSMKASPALYEERTRGPLAQYKKPMSRARWRHMSNSSGVTYLSTFKWRLVGRMYWPKVTTSTFAFLNSKIYC